MVFAPAGPESATRRSRRATDKMTGSIPRPYKTPGIWSAARKRREDGLPIWRPVSAERVAVFDTACESMTRYRYLPHGGPDCYKEEGEGSLGLVFPVEEFADACFIKNCCEGIGDDFGNGQDLDLGKLLVGKKGEGIRENYSRDG